MANTPRFNEELVQLGLEGGKQAANMLKDSVLQNCSGAPDDIEVMAKICANVGGLAQAMRRDGCLDNPDDLKQFTVGFTQGKASFDFVDVGHGKERADSKLKGMYNGDIQRRGAKQMQNLCDGTFETIIANTFFLAYPTMLATLPFSTT